MSAMNEVEAFRRTVLARQAEAEAALHQGDAGPRMEMWSRRDPVTLFGAAGMFESGRKIVHLPPVPGRWVMGLTSARAEGREDCLMLCAIGTGGGRSEITPCWVWVLRLSAEERKVPFPVVRGEG
jgi:hypothetical protein